MRHSSVHGMIKAGLYRHAQQLLALKANLSHNKRVALEEFFDASLSTDPKKRDMSLETLLQKLDAQR
jgi:hypothetical protein